MALDQEYFDSIHIDVVRKKYYNANKVEAVFADIRRQAEELMAENEALRSQAAAPEGDRRTEIGDAVISAQELYREIVNKALNRSAQITAEAERKAAAILRRAQDRAAAIEAENARQEDYSVARVERLVSRLRRQQQDSIELLNAEWQSFLCGLSTPEEREAPRPAEESFSRELEKKVSRIADELHSFSPEEP